MKSKLFFAVLAMAMGITTHSFAYDVFVSDFAVTPGQTKDVEISIYVEADDPIGTGTGAVSAKIDLPTGFDWSTTNSPKVLIGTEQVTYNSTKTTLTLGALSATSSAGKILFAKFWLTPKSTMSTTKMTLKGLKIDGNSIANKDVNITALTEITIGTGGYSSFSAYAPVQISSNAKVMSAKINSTKDKLTLTDEGDIVPSNTGVIIKGTAGDVVTLTAASSDPTFTSDLKPSVTATEVTANTTLVLSTKSTGTGFYTFTGTTITANKAYLEKSQVASSRIRISEEDEVTGIEEVEAEANVGFNYNLMGQQIKSQKGFAIENGKKVVRF